MNVEIVNSWCYDDDPKKCQQYGRLYTWDAAKKACAGLGNGWRLPTDAEWEDMIKNYGGLNSETAYKSLLKGGDSDFAALLGGVLGTSDGSYYWSSTEDEGVDGW